MITFKYASMLLYPVHLDYEQIHKIFAGWADQATAGDRSVWGLHWTGNILTIAFMRKRDWDQFAQVFQTHATTGSAPAETRRRGWQRPARTGKWSRRDFTSSYMLGFDFLNTEQIGELGTEVSEVADIVVGDDRSIYEVWFHNNEIHVGFKHEEDRDDFADIIDQEANDEVEIVSLPPQAATSLHQITVH
jgi:hypothetical protein